MATLIKLRTDARKAGMKGYRGASRSELEDYLNGSKPKVVKKKATKKAPARSTASRKPATRKAPARKSSPRSTASNRRSTASARKASTTARKPTAKPATRKRNSKASDVGWKLIGKVSFTNYDKADWNPRPDSGVGIIFKALKAAKGNRERAYEMLKGQINKLAPKTSRLGNRRSAQEQRDWLKYRINQTLFNFARATGQHESGTNRKPYNGNGKPKRNAPARARAAKPANGRRKASTSKTKAKPKVTAASRSKATRRTRKGTTRRTAGRR